MAGPEFEAVGLFPGFYVVLPELGFHHLADRREREGFTEDDLPGHLVVGQVIAAVGLQFFLCGILSRI